MSQFNSALTHKICNVLGQYMIDDRMYNVAKYNYTDQTVFLADERQHTMLKGDEIKLGNGNGSGETDFVMVNSKRFRLLGLDRYTYGTSDPAADGKLGQVYFKLITIA